MGFDSGTTSLLGLLGSLSTTGSAALGSITFFSLAATGSFRSTTTTLVSSSGLAVSIGLVWLASSSLLAVAVHVPLVLWSWM